jgi:coenzyme F420-reducing hydrogenase beta subunit
MITDGRCYSVCPRTLTDWQKIRDEALGETPYNGEVGRYHSVFKVRSTVSFNGQQDGGTVSGLLLTALEENMAGAALVTGSGEDRLTPSPILGNIDAVKRAAGSRFLSSPGMRKYR